MMALQTVKVSIHVAWWVRWYLSGVAMAARMTGATPHWGKVERWIRRGLSFRVIRRP
ncbi:hypothetical protein [Achromobacter insolitus]|uniref:hypothetical protein n=1 Tax=Achromobacter insolitus TaxID=217204 RepID=UPI00366C6547